MFTERPTMATAPHHCDEDCRGCVDCYMKTGDTICTSTCEHRECPDCRERLTDCVCDDVADAATELATITAERDAQREAEYIAAERDLAYIELSRELRGDR